MPDRQEGALPGLHLFAEQRIELSLRRLPDEEARGDNDDAKPAAGDALLDLLPDALAGGQRVSVSALGAPSGRLVRSRDVGRPARAIPVSGGVDQMTPPTVGTVRYGRRDGQQVRFPWEVTLRSIWRGSRG